MKIKAAFAVLVILAGCATPSSETEYNKGVESFRASDYSSARLHWKVATEQNVRAAYNNLGYLLYFGPSPLKMATAKRSGIWHMRLKRVRA